MTKRNKIDTRGPKKGRNHGITLSRIFPSETSLGGFFSKFRGLAG
jgi:hypothetical protein